MRILIVLLTLITLACSDECKKIDPSPDTNLGWIPFQSGNYWHYNCDPGCGSDNSPAVRYTMGDIFTVPGIDSLTFVFIDYLHFTVVDGKILAKSEDGLRLYSTYKTDDLMRLLRVLEDYQAFMDEFVLIANFGLNEGQVFSSGGKSPFDISVISKSDNEIEFSTGGKYRKGLGGINDGDTYFEVIKINGVTYNLKCK